MFTEEQRSEDAEEWGGEAQTLPSSARRSNGSLKYQNKRPKRNETKCPTRKEKRVTNPRILRRSEGINKAKVDINELENKTHKTNKGVQS